MRKKENYAPPQVKVVKFKVELGGVFTSNESNGQKTFDLEATDGVLNRNNQYSYNNWGTLGNNE